MPSRESGVWSARSLLLTVLGEFVLPQRKPVWTGALVAALDVMGVEGKTARQALSRLAAEDFLVRARRGRRVEWELTSSATELLVAGTDRIYGFGRASVPWDGQWLVVAVTVPESQREARHRLRTRLTWAGLGSPLPGLWVTPDSSKQAEVAAVLCSLSIAAFTFVGSLGVASELPQLVAAAWRLDEVERFYAEFMASFASAKIGTPAQAFASQLELVGHWRRVPFIDPGLPAELLPKRWPRRAAVDLFHRRHDRWHGPAQMFWHDLMQAAEDRT
jgi:phenylacetic acid degradation operon negative regulatory protein